MTEIAPAAGLAALQAHDFPAGTPLNAFFIWNEVQWRPDRRYTIACDLFYLYRQFGGDGAGIAICVSHIAVRPVIRWRFRSHVLISTAGLAAARRISPSLGDAPVVASARRVVTSLLASIGSTEPDLHAAVFKAFEEVVRRSRGPGETEAAPHYTPSVAGAAQDPCYQAERPWRLRPGARACGGDPPTPRHP
ncbi:MAG: hypothetical protein E6G90_11325 [Alphaproteobacteria bacterium]|nr:MAG: hypothetical protein E6G90_11325 [Alphaproteobacteria bacterium]